MERDDVRLVTVSRSGSRVRVQTVDEIEGILRDRRT